MEPKFSSQTYVSVYYIILCLHKISGKLTDIQKLEYCKHFQCDETVDEKVCGIRKENGINTYRLFDNECLLLKYGCQVGAAEAYGIINIKRCDEIVSQEHDKTNCKTNCDLGTRKPVCGIRKDGEGFSIKMFTNMCQLSKFNCEHQSQFNITDIFLCNRYNSFKSTVRRRNTDDKIYTDFSKEVNDRNYTFDKNIGEMDKSEISTEETNTIDAENINNLETSTQENINLDTSFEETSTIDTNNIETYTIQSNSKETYYLDTNATGTNNEEIITPATTIAYQDKNKTIFRNIVVVGGSMSDIQNINTTAANFFAATHVFDLPIREMESNAAERTRRRLIKVFGPVKVFTPWLQIPTVIKEDRNHTPTLSSCFHKCPTKCPDTYAPVCGVPGIVAREPSLMFQNHCFMDVAQCKMYWEDKSWTAESSAYIESSFLFCLGNELNGLYRFLPLVRTLQHMGRLKSKGKFKYRLKNMRFFNNLLEKQPHLMG